MNQQDNKTCPYCGAIVSETDKFCRNCGRTLLQPTVVTQPQPTPQPAPPTAPPEPEPEPEYIQKYTVPQRIYRLITSPESAMQDIGYAPEYTGPLVIMLLRMIIAGIAVAEVYSKFTWIGDPNLIDQVQGILSEIITIAVFIAAVLVIIYWLAKAFIVKEACDSGSGWSFATAASVTGYAYLPEVIFGIIGLVVVYALIPSITFNVNDLDATRQAISNYEAQLLPIKLVYSIPIAIIVLIWKSYLGGLGTRYGTHGRASLTLGFVVFIVLALIGVLISYALTGHI